MKGVSPIIGWILGQSTSLFLSFFLSLLVYLALSPSLFIMEGNYRNKLKNKADLSFICFFFSTITNVTN